MAILKMLLKYKMDFFGLPKTLDTSWTTLSDSIGLWIGHDFEISKSYTTTADLRRMRMLQCAVCMVALRHAGQDQPSWQ